MPLAPDTQLGPYKIVSLIGSGGMGEVYRAHDSRLRRDVALKVLPASFTNDPDRLRRFEQEARAVAALTHPNIVSVFDIGEANGTHYIVSELLEGDSLREQIPAAGLPVRKAIELAIQFANGLAAAHDRGIVHRDLKPENIFVTKTGQVKILDFGLAKLRSSDSAVPGAADQTATHFSGADHTGAGQILGTAGYMSPEQVRGDAVDHRADIFAFGSILYEMLCGQRAFKRNTSAETMTAILNDDPQDLTALPRSSPAAIPPALDRIVRHCLEKQPAQRFQSAHDVAFDLESISTISSGSAQASSAAAKRNRWLIPAVAARRSVRLRRCARRLASSCSGRGNSKNTSHHVPPRHNHEREIPPGRQSCLLRLVGRQAVNALLGQPRQHRVAGLGHERRQRFRGFTVWRARRRQDPSLSRKDLSSPACLRGSPWEEAHPAT